MGRDAGIYVSKPLLDSKIPFYVDLHDLDDELEVCYWRKCNGISNDINGYLFGKVINDAEKELTIEDLKKIKEIINYWSNGERWDNEGGSMIWNYVSFKYNLERQRRNMRWLIRYKTAHPEAVVKFYDSW